MAGLKKDLKELNNDSWLSLLTGVQQTFSYGFLENRAQNLQCLLPLFEYSRQLFTSPNLNTDPWTDHLVSSPAIRNTPSLSLPIIGREGVELEMIQGFNMFRAIEKK